MAKLISPGVSIRMVDTDYWHPLKYYHGPTYNEILEFTTSRVSITAEDLRKFYDEHKVFTKLKDPDQIFD